MSCEAMQKALDALEYHTMQTRPITHTDKAIEALKEALAEPEQETVALNKNMTLGCPAYLHELPKPEQEPEIVRRVRGYAGKRRESVGSPHITAKECIALANWIDSMLAAPPRKEWVGLTSEDWENTPDTGKQGCERDAELFDWVEQTLKDKNESSC
jgi:hypothetical protein